MNQKKILFQNLILFFIFILGGIAWMLPVPESLTNQSWHLLLIFLCTIVGIILSPLSMGAIAFLSIACCVLTKTLTLTECLSGFADEIVWLIVLAFFISHGFIKTGLGARIAYLLIRSLGRSTLGLSYSLVFTDLVLSPAIPSVTARGGGILFPVANALCKTYSDETHPGVSTRNGGFLVKVCMQSNVITSAMFLTAMAANPVAVKLAALSGITITWFGWALAAFVPGLTCLIVMPLIVYYLYPPAIKHSDSAPNLAKQKLKEMGAISLQEKLMMMIFLILIFLWVFGPNLFGINATATALVGFCLLLLFRMISFEETIGDKSAWHTFIWFATLLMISSFLSKMGIMNWIGIKLQSSFSGLSPTYSIIFLSLVYFYIHYIFASATAHITVLFPTFLLLFTASGVPDMVAALMLTFLSILSSGLTHFGLSSSPIFFGAGYVKTKTWWYIGLIMSIVNIIIWSTIGAAWWKILALW